MRAAARASVAFASLLLLAKGIALAASGSVAMLSSLADTSLDLLASLVTLFAIGYAVQPADANHRFGHGKAEAIAALAQVGLIIVSAAGILWHALGRLADPQSIAAPALGIGVSLLAMGGTLALVAYQRRAIRKTGSIAIATDSIHYQSDLLLNASVIAAFALQSSLGWRWVDPVCGALIAVYLAYGASQNARKALDMLMDREMAVEDRGRIVRAALSHPSVQGLHEMRTRQSGLDVFIQFHIWVAPDLTVRAGHRIADEVEAAVRRVFPAADIIIHVDPEGLPEAGERDVQYRAL